MTSAFRRLSRAGTTPLSWAIALWLCCATSAAADDLVLRWNDIGARTANATNPFLQARHSTIVQLAVFEAVNAITGEYESYLASPPQAAEGASVDAAVVTAAHHVLRTYFPAAGATLDAERDADLAAIPDGQSKTDGIALGLAAANALITLRSSDGALPLTTVNYAADEISRIGVDRILKRIEDVDSWGAPSVELIEPDLVVRDSA